MVTWDSIIRFEAEDGSILFAPLFLATYPEVGLKVEGYSTIEALEASGLGKISTVKKVSRILKTPRIRNVSLTS
jgi:hypothetical protein